MIVTEADSLIVPPPVINGELGETDENSCSEGLHQVACAWKKVS